MPPRFAYWTIILDGTPTSFRAREREELLPTFNQLKKKDPTAMMKWFSGGTLWDSPEQASEKRRLEREARFNQLGRNREERRPSAGRPSGDRPSGDRARDDRPSSDRPHAGRPRAERPRDEGRRGAPPVGERAPDKPVPPAPPASGEAVRKPRTLPRLKSLSGATGLPVRPKGWRPGGEHRDPKDKYKLPPGEARKRWKRRNLGPAKRT